jgi:hypothetical protein
MSLCFKTNYVELQSSIWAASARVAAGNVPKSLVKFRWPAGQQKIKQKNENASEFLHSAYVYVIYRVLTFILTVTTLSNTHRAVLYLKNAVSQIGFYL